MFLVNRNKTKENETITKGRGGRVPKAHRAKGFLKETACATRVTDDFKVSSCPCTLINVLSFWL